MESWEEVDDDFSNGFKWVTNNEQNHKLHMEKSKDVVGKKPLIRSLLMIQGLKEEFVVSQKQHYGLRWQDIERKLRVNPKVEMSQIDELWGLLWEFQNVLAWSKA